MSESINDDIKIEHGDDTIVIIGHTSELVHLLIGTKEGPGVALSGTEARQLARSLCSHADLVDSKHRSTVRVWDAPASEDAV